MSLKDIGQRLVIIELIVFIGILDEAKHMFNLSNDFYFVVMVILILLTIYNYVYGSE